MEQIVMNVCSKRKGFLLLVTLLPMFSGLSFDGGSVVVAAPADPDPVGIRSARTNTSAPRMRVPGPEARLNVLFIAIDDMNDWTTVFDTSNPIQTPNLQRLAARGTFFENAYCAAPACAPSRAAIMTYGRGNHAIKTPEFRYIRYHDGSEELYTHEDSWNIKNRVNDVELKSVLEQHRRLLETALR